MVPREYRAAMRDIGSVTAFPRGRYPKSCVSVLQLLPDGYCVAAKLHFVDIDGPGITRRLIRGKWAYFGPDGKRIGEAAEIARLNAIALPPAYSDAWFSDDPLAHILATGIDARGRKQYRYHPDFRALREGRKFANCVEFGRALPLLRKRVEGDLRGRSLSADRAIASIVRLLDCCHIRVGNESYAQANGSYGATTLRGRHARVEGGKLKLTFRAKSGRLCRIAATDKGLIRFVRQVQDLPGQRLFQYLDGDGVPHPVTSTDVNAYIKDAGEGDFTAKDFRTWGASVLAFECLSTREEGSVGQILDCVAAGLGNTPAVVRKSYVHPVLVEMARSGERPAGPLPRNTKWLSATERGLIALLEQRA